MFKKSLLVLIIFLSKSMITVSQNASLQIEVKDKKTKEFLPFAVAKVKSAEGFLKNVITDVNGKVVISDISPGAYSVEIFYIGYRQDSISVTVKSAKSRSICIEMESAVIICSEIEIVSDRTTEGYSCCIIRCGYNCCPWGSLSDISSKDSIPENEAKMEVAQAIKCYPNPTAGVLYVETPENAKEISVIDASGKLVQQYNLQDEQKLTIDMSGFAPGIYLVNYLDEDKLYSERVVVAH